LVPVNKVDTAGLDSFEQWTPTPEIDLGIFLELVPPTRTFPDPPELLPELSTPSDCFPLEELLLIELFSDPLPAFPFP
jgi:hypothetical protein